MLHTDLLKNRWFELSLVEQFANIGSEVERAIRWKKKNKPKYANFANMRALELFDLTLKDARYTSEIKEITRARELWLDYFSGENLYKQTKEQWQKYFFAFAYAARNK